MVIHSLIEIQEKEKKEKEKGRPSEKTAINIW